MWLGLVYLAGWCDERCDLLVGLYGFVGAASRLFVAFDCGFLGLVVCVFV